MRKKWIPSFQSEDEEREFWSRADSTEYVDWSKARRAAFANLRPTEKRGQEPFCSKEPRP